MHVHHVLAVIQPQTEIFAGGFGGVIRLEDALLRCRGHAWAVVADGDGGFARGADIGKRDPAGAAHGFDSVADEVGQRFADMRRIAVQRRVVAAVDFDAQRVGVRRFADDLLEQRANVAVAGVENHAAGVHPRSLEERAR